MATSYTRQQMEDLIATGHSVLHNNRIIVRAADLPTEADLAEGDAGLTQAALDGIEAQQAALDAQRTKLLASQGQSVKAKRAAKSGVDAAPPDAPPLDGTGE